MLLLQTPPAEMQRRVRERVNHPGGVQGEAGARRSDNDSRRLVVPTYAEGFTLISTAGPADVARVCGLYAGVLPRAMGVASPPPQPPLPPPPPSEFALSCGSHLPAVALGTMDLKGDALRVATSVGFGAIDTAPTYENEAAVGSCLGERYLIVKVPHKAVDADAVRLAVDESLRRLRRSACELLLLHWPANAIVKGALREVWRAMEGLRAAGKCTSLGVCNFNSAALGALLADCEVRPAVNQVERHPLLPQWELLDFCARQRIVMQAHTPLGHGAAAVLRHDTVQRVAREAGLAPAQVLLQWNLRHGVAVVPKCSSITHANEVLAAMPPAAPALSAAQMEAIDAIGNGSNGGPMGSKRFVNPPFSARC